MNDLNITKNKIFRWLIINWLIFLPILFLFSINNSYASKEFKQVTEHEFPSHKNGSEYALFQHWMRHLLIEGFPNTRVQQEHKNDETIQQFSSVSKPTVSFTKPNGRKYVCPVILLENIKSFFNDIVVSQETTEFNQFILDLDSSIAEVLKNQKHFRTLSIKVLGPSLSAVKSSQLKNSIIQWQRTYQEILRDYFDNPSKSEIAKIQLVNHILGLESTELKVTNQGIVSCIGS